jgi:hypothetical protein
MLEEAGGFGPDEVALVRSILFYFILGLMPRCGILSSCMSFWCWVEA